MAKGFYDKDTLKKKVMTTLPYLSLSEGQSSGKFEVEITGVKFVEESDRSKTQGVCVTVKVEESSDPSFAEDSEAQIGFWDDPNSIGLQNFRRMIKQLDPNTSDKDLSSEKFLNQFDNSNGKGSLLVGVRCTITAREKFTKKNVRISNLTFSEAKA
jgi:hypothetical protein